jgi:tetratricopeptide (TPR) repeat protein
VSAPALLLLVGLLYIVLFGGLSLLRREGLSSQFAVEALIITAIASGLAAMTSFSIHPVLFLVLLYLITMRTRVLVDLGNLFARRGDFGRAETIYNLANLLWPDRTGRFIIKVNQTTAYLQQGRLDEAIASFQDILQSADQGYLGVKYEAAVHYNLGVAYRRKELEPQATREFNAAIETWPASEYARQAEIALSKKTSKK